MATSGPITYLVMEDQFLSVARGASAASEYGDVEPPHHACAVGLTGPRQRGCRAQRAVLRIRLYSWAAVSAWLAATGRGEAEPGVAETAVAAAEVDAYLAVRRALQNAPSAYRDRVARLSAA
jgi:hypothetical protein